MSQHDTRSSAAHHVFKEESRTVEPKFNLCEISAVYELLKLSGNCYIKEHVMCALNADKTGWLKEWHTKVTIGNLNHLTAAAKEMGLTLPFPKPLEQRENEIKAHLGKCKEQVITDGEVFKELMNTGRQLENMLTNACLYACHEKLRNAFCEMKKVTADHYIKTCEQLKSTDSFFPLPIVEKFTFINSGITERK